MTVRPNRTERRFVVSLLAFPLASAAGAQDASGKVENWPGGAADLLFWQVGEDPQVAGRVTDDGTVTLDLPMDVETPQQLSQVFRCADDSETNTDPDAPYAITSTLQYLRPERVPEITGKVVVATTEDVAAHHGAGGTVAAGRSYQWIYTPRAAEIEGVCTSDFYPDGKTRMEQTSWIDMSLQPGWNILEVEVAETGSLSDEMSFALGRNLRIVDALPAEARWFYWPG